MVNMILLINLHAVVHDLKKKKKKNLLPTDPLKNLMFPETRHFLAKPLGQ